MLMFELANLISTQLLFDYIAVTIPFLTVFAIVEQALKMSGIFKDNKAARFTISLAISLVTTFGTPVGPWLQQFYALLFGTGIMILFIFVVLIFSILLSAIRGEEKTSYILILVAFFLAYKLFEVSGVYNLISSYLPGGISNITSYIFTPEVAILFIILAILYYLITYFLKEPESES